MFGKIFESLYTDSMIGAGSPVFAVWGYVIANQRPDKVVGYQVELNPKLLAMVIGEAEQNIEKAIDYLCSPDPGSRSQEEEGRRLVRLGQFTYRVVNGTKYQAIRNAETRREQNRVAQERFRKRRAGEGAVPAAPKRSKASSTYVGRENRFVEALGRGDEVKADQNVAEGLLTNDEINDHL